MNAPKRVLILGLGTSGESAARMLAGEGLAVTVVDAQSSPALQERAAALRRRGVDARLGVADLPCAATDPAYDLCVPCPGVRADSPWMQEVRRRGVPVLPELELGLRRCPCRQIVVTGSKGKSTLVKFCRDALRAAGRRAEMAGNCGPPVCDVVGQARGLDWLVVEASSFQLEIAESLRPDVAVLLNVLPDHLDRHANLEAYGRIKARLFAAMPATGLGVVPHAARDWVARVSGGANRWASFGPEADATARYAAHGVRIGDAMAPLAGTRFDNEILGPAAAAAALALREAGVDAATLARTAREFVPLPHRLQDVAVLRGVRFVNDSKATNLAAMAAALRVCGGRVRLIAGGLLKEKELGGVKEVLAKTTEGLYLIGKAASPMNDAWGDVAKCRLCGTLDEAVAAAWRDAAPGETVLLSPACASFDQFRNFEERGDRFVSLVNGLARTVGGSPG
jgi:UDP-N-acetylmuramoylalanine--D-glutamate ligase